jgi:hypothetical protein
MYRSPYHFREAPARHRDLPTTESLIASYFGGNQEDAVTIPYQVREQHLYVPGKTRHGKSTLFHAMAYQDFKNGAGVCIIDPKGDLVSSLLNWIPEERKDDCVFISPKSPVPINFLDYKDDDEKETLVGELKYVITKGGDAREAPLMDAILTDLIYTLLNANENPKMPEGERATFLDIYRFLEEPDRQNFIKSFVTDKQLLNRWVNNFPHPKERAPTLTRMTPFVRNPSLRKLFDCPNPGLNIANLMDNRKILLIDLGGISDSTRILGTLIIAKIRQTAFRRAALPVRKRIPFFLYVDEFEFFQTSDFDQILSFAAGYGLRLTLANQFIAQLDNTIRQSIFGNVGSFIIFCVSAEDARLYKHLVPDEVHVSNLPRHFALYRIAGQQAIVKPTLPPPPEPKPEQIFRADYIRKRTLETYACKAAPMADTSANAKPDPEATPASPPNDAGGASGARDPLRSQEPRGRTYPPQKRTDRKRYTDDKPEP